MQKISLILLLIIFGMETFSQYGSTDRKPAVAGRFYATDKETLEKDISRLFSECKKSTVKSHVRALISPHAGYVFSGKIAAAAFSTIDASKEYKNVFLIGSSHIMAFEGASVYSEGDFITPLGKIKVNSDIANRLKNENKLFQHPSGAHIKEHSLEVQIPFIQYHLAGNPSIVPIIIGTTNSGNIKKIAEILRSWFTSDNLFVVSSDFSHYPSYKTALEVDNITADAIVSGKPSKFLNAIRNNSLRNDPGLATSMCGWTSGLLLMYLAENDDRLEFKHIDYCNSGDSRYGDKDGVVGYHAIVLAEKRNNSPQSAVSMNSINFTEKEKDELLSLARNNIRSILYNNKGIDPDPKKMPAIFKEPLGAFVTLKINGKLRGCIGRFVSSDPLYEAILESSRSSAFEDPRFFPLTKEEFENADLEITVLGPLKKINSINEIVLGKHGIYIKKGSRSGTMLPQVATENGWTLEEFLGYTSRDKAGLGWHGWKDAELSVYEGIILEEKR